MKYVLSHVLLLICTVSFGQDYTIDWGEPMMDKAELMGSFFILKESEDVLYIKVFNNDSYVETYNYDLDLVDSELLNVTSDNIELILLDLVGNDDNKIAFFKGAGKKNKFKKFIAKFDGQNFTEVKELEFNNDELNDYPFYKYFNSEFHDDVPYSFINSESNNFYCRIFCFKDKTNGTIYGYDGLENVNEYNHFKIFMFDENMDKVWEKVVDFKDEEATVFLSNVQVSNKGEVYLSYGSLLKNKYVEKGTPNYAKFNLLKVTENNNTDISIVEDYNNRRVTNVAFYLDEENQKGYYFGHVMADENNQLKNGISGTMTVMIDLEDNDNIKVNYQDIDKDYISSLLDDKVIKTKGGFGYVDFKNIEKTANNEFVLVFENNYKITPQQYIHERLGEGAEIAETPDYYSEQILCHYIDKEGDLLNTLYIEKELKTKHEELTSFKFIEYNSKHFFICNTQYKKNGSNFINMTVIDSDRNVEFSGEIDEKKYSDNLGFKPEYTFEKDGQLYITRQLALNKYNIGRMKLD